MIAHPDFTRVVDHSELDDVALGRAAADWRPRKLRWSNEGNIGDVANMSSDLQIFSPASAKILALAEYGDLLPLTVEGTPYLLFDCRVTVPEADVVDRDGSQYFEGKLIGLRVRCVAPTGAPAVFRIAGAEAFLIWTEPLARRVRRECAGAIVLPWDHAS